MKEPPISCEVCGENIRGHSNLKDGRLLCGLCLDDELNPKPKCVPSQDHDGKAAFGLCLYDELNAKPKCIWKEDQDGNWESGCSYAFSFNEDGPLEADWKFCPACGHPLTEKPYVEPVVEDEP